MKSLRDFAYMFAIDAVDDMVSQGIVAVENSDLARIFLAARFVAIMESTALSMSLSPPLVLEVAGVYKSDDDDSVVCLSSWSPLVRNLKE
jgi:hypothetical protein